MLKGENIICFAGEDWWYHNPHSNGHIMKSFAKSNRVLFINSIGVSMPNIRGNKFALRQIFKKMRSMLKYIRKVGTSIYVLTPFAVPFVRGYESLIEIINKYLLLAQLALIVRILRFKNPVLWVCVPSAKDVALHLRKKGAKCLVYYCVDNISYYHGVNQDYVKDLDITIQKKSDLSLFVNRQLVEERKIYNKNTYHIEHGVDYEQFSKCQNNCLPIPEDIKNIKTPIAGYIGVIEGVDFELVKYIAEKNQDVSFVFIGEISTDLDKIRLPNNVYFLGRRPYDVLPNYLRAFACCCLYYERKNVFDNYRAPKKLKEYLATGKPVVAISNLEIKYFSDYVYVANTYSEFNEYLYKAIYEDPPQMREKRIRYAQGQTWDYIAEQASKHILNVIEKNRIKDVGRL